MSEEIKKNFLFLLLCELEKGTHGATNIAKNLNVYPQKLNYWIGKALELGWIEKAQSYPYAIYEITPIGKRIKEKITQGEEREIDPYWRLHAKILKWEVKDLETNKNGHQRIPENKWNHIKEIFKEHKKMNGWQYVLEEVKTDKGIFTIIIQETGLIKITLPEKYTHDKPRTWAELENKALQIATKYSENWELELNPMRVSRNGEEELVNSHKLAKLLGKVKVKDFWVDASTGTDWIEQTEGTNKIEQLIGMPERLEVLIKTQEVFNNSLQEYNKNIEMHLEVMNEIKNYFKKLNEKP